ncbi:amidohydrolase [Egibacter rhizosphaerae]|uniref:Amidohydrolase n=1 Tax=Egibacter rhizosphaerae TaxID=1670831 RepID=A0A411YF52_9ACTN|nr:amidohydrolase family protein [Egibacter rhizosphaerae]QBI19850.1 amidohydrolase [Egibacter rhizosphaerae]
MTTILAHALVLTVDDRRRVLPDGAVAFDERSGRITAVGPADEVTAAAPSDAAIVDCTDRVITPGFVDTHVHLGEQLGRGLVPDHAGPTEWLPDWLFHLYGALEPDDERTCAELAVAELLLTGTTTFCEAGTLLDWRAAADVVEATGIRGQLGRWTSDQGPDGLPRLETTRAALDANEAMLDGCRDDYGDRVSASVILLGLGTASEPLLREAKELATDRGAGAAVMHASVHPDHGGQLVPAETLEELGWLDGATKLTHAVYVDMEDVERFAEAGVRVAHCPTAALRHVKGLHRYGLIPEMLESGVPVGLGSDSANGSNHFRMLQLMYLAATLYKDFRMDQRMIPPETALEMATRQGAACLWLDDEIGSLEVGKRADLVAWSTEHPEWRPLLHPVQNLVLNAPDRSVESVWVNGQQLVERGRLRTIDLDELLPRADAAASGLLARADLRAPWSWPSEGPGARGHHG